jgi:hypothetical protein
MVAIGLAPAKLRLTCTQHKATQGRGWAQTKELSVLEIWCGRSALNCCFMAFL